MFFTGLAELGLLECCGGCELQKRQLSTCILKFIVFRDGEIKRAKGWARSTPKTQHLCGPTERNLLPISMTTKLQQKRIRPAFLKI